MVRGIPRSWRMAALPLAVALLVTAAAPAAADPEPPPDAVAAGAEPPPPEEMTAGSALEEFGRDLADARHAAETAEQRFTAADLQLDRRKRESADAEADAERERARVVEAELQAARLVGELYRNGSLGSLGPVARLLLSGDPEEFLGRQWRAFEQTHTAAEVLGGLHEARARLVLAAEQARQAEQAAATASQDAQRALDVARTAADRTARLLESTPADQLDLLEQLESDRADQAREEMLAAGTFGPGGSASEAGRQAIAYALAQLGKPYLWGGTGPDAFDCSGLTSQAWQSAGVSIPRTSEEQWAALKRIPLRELRPGDLVVYDNDAGHIALYLGGGTVVHAPHTGTVIKLAPVPMLPILGAVRPDPQAPSVRTDEIPAPPADTDESQGPSDE
ncbi:C40 family peptidase [Kitasatospora griseola]|uniref:C40 family peptidase n=1 Tax=Kitasatospora griseola TaxID=2064 RepID=UPI0006960CAC|nr:C40 family peptidase [Kitasatospora griseola]